MRNNPTGAMGVRDHLGHHFVSRLGAPLVNLPGCPVEPDVITETLQRIALEIAGVAPPTELDDQGRPLWLFERTAHETCDRAGLAEHAATRRRSPTTVRAWRKSAARVPSRDCNVPARGWVNGVGGCPNVGGICIACTMPGFPDRDLPFMDSHPAHPPRARRRPFRLRTRAAPFRARSMGEVLPRRGLTSAGAVRSPRPAGRGGRRRGRRRRPRRQERERGGDAGPSSPARPTAARIAPNGRTGGKKPPNSFSTSSVQTRITTIAAVWWRRSEPTATPHTDASAPTATIASATRGEVAGRRHVEVVAARHQQDDRERDRGADGGDDGAERRVGDQLRGEHAAAPRRDQVGADDRAVVELAGGGEGAEEEQHQRGEEARADGQRLAGVGGPARLALADLVHRDGRDSAVSASTPAIDGPGAAGGGDLEPFGADEAGHRASSFVPCVGEVEERGLEVGDLGRSS